MYREWLGKMLEGAERGTKARLAERLGISGDMVSKMLSGVRDITADELPQISAFFKVMPPGFDGISFEAKIRDEKEILRTLERIDGLGPDNVTVLLSAISGFQRANAAQPEPSRPDDRSERATPRRESTPSR